MQRSGIKKNAGPSPNGGGSSFDAQRSFLTKSFKPKYSKLPHRMTKENLKRLEHAVKTYRHDNGKHFQIDPNDGVSEKVHKMLKQLPGTDLVWYKDDKFFRFVRFKYCIGSYTMWFHIRPLFEKWPEKYMPTVEVIKKMLRLMNRQMGLDDIRASHPFDWISMMLYDEIQIQLEQVDEQLERNEIDPDDAEFDKTVYQGLIDMLSEYELKNGKISATFDRLLDFEDEKEPTVEELKKNLSEIKPNDDTEKEILLLIEKGLKWCKPEFNIHEALRNTIDYKRDGYSSYDEFIEDYTNNGMSLMETEVLIGLSYDDTLFESRIDDSIQEMIDNADYNNLGIIKYYIGESLDPYREDVANDESERMFGWLIEFHQAYMRFMNLI